ncbi:MAG: hypothetical protein TREMPRED_002016 [Tremellales sp. Tagirdzhanova-0007]|nr:MAG: hypothetical protein TREMPRED_002016 [Tremellales sp. Tagirdzhanova-0007]
MAEEMEEDANADVDELAAEDGEEEEATATVEDERFVPDEDADAAFRPAEDDADDDLDPSVEVTAAVDAAAMVELAAEANNAMSVSTWRGANDSGCDRFEIKSRRSHARSFPKSWVFVMIVKRVGRYGMSTIRV